MTREDKRAYNYARDRLANDDYPVYSDEYELELAYKAGIEDAKNHPNWISVEDELPPKEENVLIWSSGSKEAMIGYYIGRNWQRKTNDFYSYVDDGYWHNVTHWMPLPAPPKKGGEQ